MYRAMLLAATLVLIPGCFVLFPTIFGPSGDLTGSPELKRFESEQELSDYLTDQIGTRNQGYANGLFDDWFMAGIPTDMAAEDGGDAVPSPTSGPQGGASGDADESRDSFSQTTIQEIGVDEADVVKTDGTYIYVIFEESLWIVRVSPPEQFGLVKKVGLEGHGREIYLHDNKVIALTETWGGYVGFGGGGVIEPDVPDAVAVETVEDPSTEGTEAPPADEGDPGDAGTDDEPVDSSIDVAPEIDVRYERPSTIVTILDVSTPDDTRRISTTSFEGSPASSRMIDGVLHMVVSNFEGYYFDVLPLLGEPELDVTSIDTAELLPHYERVDEAGNANSGAAVTWREMYRPTDPDGFGVVTVISLDTGDPAAEFTAVGIVAEPGSVYSSLEALYLTDTEWTSLGDMRETTDIYKLAYDGARTVAVATGTVPGRILNQYSMGEYQGYLRVATTVGPTFGPFGTRSEPTNNVYVLEDVDGTLTTAGAIENIAPGETIQSARFLGDKGYVVTFEQIDPLFTLDLVDPRNPRIVGELKVPGFSTFIVPMDEDHLLTVGQYIPVDGAFWFNGVQLSIFDISDFANPVLSHNVVIGEQDEEAWSEALHNPKAFNYLAEKGLVALPVETYSYGPFFGVVDTEPGVREEPAPTGTDDAPEPDEPAPPPEEPVEGIEPFVPDEFHGLVVYAVSAEDGFEELGRISTRYDQAYYYWTAFTRGRFIGDNVFAVTNQGVRGAPVADLETVIYEVKFEE